MELEFRVQITGLPEKSNVLDVAGRIKRSVRKALIRCDNVSVSPMRIIHEPVPMILADRIVEDPTQ
jgi:hypothetical protein